MTFFDRAKTIPPEVVDKLEGRFVGGFSKVFKFNPYHDEKGLFTSADGQASTSYGKEANGHAAKLQALSRTTEAALSPTIKSVLPEGAKLVFWESRLKTESSTARKIFKDAQNKKISMEEAAQHIGDGVRYTITAAPKNYARVVKETMEGLAKAGYHVLPGKFKNYWAKEGEKPGFYQGININMVAPTGQKWELQFHTPQSFKVKEHVNHRYYEEHRLFPVEERRLSSARVHRKRRLEAIMVDNQTRVRRPPGASEIHFP